MKKIYAAFILSLVTFGANATIIVVSATGSSTFSPNSITDVVVGDTVRFVQTGGSHNTVSVSVPVGAATWNHNFSAGSFDYKVTVAGNYAYQCTFHGGMVGAFSAADPVAEVANVENNIVSKAYPNPFKSKITIAHKSAEVIEVFSMLGERVKVLPINTLEKTTVLDLSDLKKGVYFYVIKNNDVILETRRIIKSE